MPTDWHIRTYPAPNTCLGLATHDRLSIVVRAPTPEEAERRLRENIEAVEGVWDDHAQQGM